MTATTTTTPLMRPSVRHVAAPRREAQPASPLDQPMPRPGECWRHPLRFVRSRIRMMFGRPLSARWGLDRGGLPPHRYYANLFLEEFRDDIRGNCLEFEDRNYIDRFGSDAVEHVDILHLDHSNTRATVIADITQPNDIPDDTYDCIVSTYVLHVIPDVPAAIAGLHRILRPGGVLLCVCPSIMGAGGEELNDMWRFTRLGMRHLLTPVFGEDNVDVRTYGNSIVAAGEMRGMLADEFTWRELHNHDPMFGVGVCARAVKA